MISLNTVKKLAKSRDCLLKCFTECGSQLASWLIFLALFVQCGARLQGNISRNQFGRAHQQSPPDPTDDVEDQVPAEEYSLAVWSLLP